jgi:hypothetical protein
MHEVACLISNEWKAVNDIGSATKFIQKAIFSKKTTIDWDDFNAIFCKGIFRYVIVNTAK